MEDQEILDRVCQMLTQDLRGAFKPALDLHCEDVLGTYSCLSGVELGEHERVSLVNLYLLLKQRILQKASEELAVSPMSPKAVLSAFVLEGAKQEE